MAKVWKVNEIKRGSEGFYYRLTFARHEKPYKLGQTVLFVNFRRSLSVRKDSESAIQRKRIILTIAGGGFFWQSKSLANGLSDGFEIHYVTPDDPADHAQQGLPSGEIHHVSRITIQAEATLLHKIGNTLRSFGDAYRVIRNVKPEVVVCVASPIAVPLCFWSKLLGIRAVFVESITRVTSPSVTGTILSAFRLCDRLYVQWPEAERLYRGAIYRGTVL